jgi:hypothetical protein
MNSELFLFWWKLAVCFVVFELILQIWFLLVVNWCSVERVRVLELHLISSTPFILRAL